MYDEWKLASLGEAADVLAGFAFKSKQYTECPDDHRLLRGDNIAQGTIRWDNGKRWQLDPTDERLGAYLLEEGDIVLAMDRPWIEAGLKYSRLRPDDLPALLVQRVARLRAREGFDQGFLAAIIGSGLFTSYIQSMTTGTAVPHISAAHIKAYQFLYPPLPEQQAIADILGALDDKIELNRKMNATLDELARTIFRSWFVDFDPVRAKAEGREPFGMDAETAALFPDRFTDSELGPIPEGWRVSTIGEEVSVLGGSTPSTKNPDFWDGGTHLWATPKDLSGLASPILIETDRRITDAGVRQISSRQLPNGTVLLSSRAPVGYLALTTEPTSINQGFIAMVCDRSLPNYYVLNWARESMEVIKGNAGGTTFAEISKAAFRPIRVVVPGEPVLGSFVETVAPLYGMVDHNLRESRTLAELRDTLLPELISGRIRVPAEQAVAGAV